MSKVLIIPKQVITADSNNNIFRNCAVEVEDKVIKEIHSLNHFSLEGYDGEIVDAAGLTLIPGFIQTHVHLCQTLFRGLADDLQLLDWLRLKIFPFENAHNEDSLRLSARLGIYDLISGGTTTLLDMGTLRHQEVVFEELISSGIRAFAGKCMMDENSLFPSFKADTDDEIKKTYELAKGFHNSAGGRIRYGFAPRFVLSCSANLFIETKEMMKDFPGSIFHTHSSENKMEIAEVRKRFSMENIEYFDFLNVLSDHSVLAHCIHLNEKETALIKKHNTGISHCPSSNMKLGSGVADIPKYMREGIKVSLGADGAPCNNSLSIFNEMRLAALLQKPFYNPTVMNAETVFRMATIDGAKALNIENETGSIEIGKKADLVLLDLEKPDQPLSSGDENIYSSIVYSASKENVKQVMADGKWLYKNYKSLQHDEKELYHDGKEELKKLIDRAFK